MYQGQFFKQLDSFEYNYHETKTSFYSTELRVKKCACFSNLIYAWNQKVFQITQIGQERLLSLKRL